MKTTLLLASATLAFTAGAAELSTIQSPQPTPIPAHAPPVRPAPAPPPFTSPEAMQAEFVRRFEASPGFGLSRVVRPVFLAPVPALVFNGTTYRVAPPDLIGLEDDPVAYAPREHGQRISAVNGTNVTRREVRRLFTHRPLSALETNAILALSEGRDLVVLTNRVARPEAELELLEPAKPSALLVLGALRAGKTCAACHQCEQGTLLGAFAYNLMPLATPTDGGTDSPALRSNLLARLRLPVGRWSRL